MIEYWFIFTVSVVLLVVFVPDLIIKYDEEDNEPYDGWWKEENEDDENA